MYPKPLSPRNSTVTVVRAGRLTVTLASAHAAVAHDAPVFGKFNTDRDASPPRHPRRGHVIGQRNSVRVIIGRPGIEGERLSSGSRRGTVRNFV